MKILHISYDYPDEINPNKTVAMKNLIDISNKFADEVFYISLNRVNSIKKEVALKKENGFELSTFGFPLGILFRYTLNRSINNIVKLNVDYNKYDVIHAHKLTFEGPIAYYLFNKYNKKYIISMQQTDFKILNIRYDLLNYYKNILLKCEKIIVISPWMIKSMKNIFGDKFYNRISYKIVNIPLIVDNRLAYGDSNGRFVTVFHMKKKNLKIKNIKRVLEAICSLKRVGIDVKLDIIGEGSGKEYIKRKIKKYKLQDNVKLLGRINNKNIINILKKYKAFILCSYPETFGMVYIEALQSGIPIIYTNDAGVDGFFNKKNIGIKVNYKSIKNISNAICEMNKNYDIYKKNVLLLQNTNELSYFYKYNVGLKYKKIFQEILIDL